MDSSKATWREKLHEIIFEAHTPAGRAFDLVLLWCILLSILAVMLESVAAIQVRWGKVLYVTEWIFTLLFTVEYVLRLICLRHPLRYAKSFFGVIDLLAIIPTYLSLYFTGAQTLLVVRSFRLLRVFRILKLARFLGEARTLISALRASLPKVVVFLGVVLTIVLIMGSLMYLIEGQERGFTSIPRSIYWAIVTLTTVGYGDITPQTILGQAVAGLVMITGYCIIAVPTGIVTAEISRLRQRVGNQHCPVCLNEDNDDDALFCKYCGERLSTRIAPKNSP